MNRVMGLQGRIPRVNSSKTKPKPPLAGVFVSFGPRLLNDLEGIY